MKRKKPRQKQSSPNRKTEAKAATPQDSVEQPGRRDFLGLMKSWGLVGVAVAGGGVYLISEVTATIAEHDLSRIGNGVPAVDQIHDPQCPRCIALQNEARAAMEQFDDGQLQYLVANIKSDKGRKLATAHGVQHVTLLLMDAEGNRQAVITGPSTAEALSASFRAHVGRFSGS